MVCLCPIGAPQCKNEDPGNALISLLKGPTFLESWSWGDIRGEGEVGGGKAGLENHTSMPGSWDQVGGKSRIVRE